MTLDEAPDDAQLFQLGKHLIWKFSALPIVVNDRSDVLDPEGTDLVPECDFSLIEFRVEQEEIRVVDEFMSF